MGINRIRTETGRIISPNGWEYVGPVSGKTLRKLKPCKKCRSTVQAWWEEKDKIRRIHSVCLECWVRKNSRN